MSELLNRVCSVGDIKEGSSKGFQVNGHSIFVVNKHESIHVYKNSCPHLGIQLEMLPDQFLDSTHSLIQCSMHGALFRIEDGLCISGPCFDQKLTSIEYKIIDQSIYLSE